MVVFIVNTDRLLSIEIRTCSIDVNCFLSAMDIRIFDNNLQQSHCIKTLCQSFRNSEIMVVMVGGGRAVGPTRKIVGIDNRRDDGRLGGSHRNCGGLVWFERDKMGGRGGWLHVLDILITCTFEKPQNEAAAAVKRAI
uniref:Uncharacterized protein n=1 Tax=Romanomermis culicivorax TaxID=13658 RepID=A0A915IV23_ROMCU